jgi:hypothetical protein
VRRAPLAAWKRHPTPLPPLTPPEVENPIPFADSLATRLRSTAHLHARYAGLLVAPLRLSADWSFACIPLVEAWGDPRNLLSVALYAWLAWVALSARPLALARELARELGLAGRGGGRGTGGGAARGRQAAGGDAAAARGAAAARWRLFVAASLVVGPFFPASNVLFYVGTFIGERLLYMPSLGFCLLLAQLLGDALLPSAGGAPGGGAPTTGAAAAPPAPAAGDTAGKEQDNANSAAPQRGAKAGRGAGLLALALVAAPLLALYAGRTVTRNADWRDEEALFRSALDVCPDSAKVQLNMGILMRRHQQFGDALAHFR